MSSGLSYADRMRQPAKQKARPANRAVGHNRQRVGGPRQPQPQRPQQRMGRPMNAAPQVQPQRRPQQPVQWNPEQLLDKSKCEIFCKVRKVHSGDQLRLQYAFPDRSQPSIDFLLVLDWVMAPRVSRSPNDTEEEAFGFEAREFLRKFLNGAVVRCVWNKDKGQNKKRLNTPMGAALKELEPEKQESGDFRLARVFGELQCLRDNPKQPYSEAVYKDENNWVDVATLMCSMGWARTKRMSDDAQSPLWQRCKAAEENAKERQLGIHQNVTEIRRHTRNLDWSPSVEALYEQFKNKPIQGIVEDVREGSTIRCEIYMPTDDNQIRSTMLWVCLSGIQAERMPKPVKTQRNEHKERQRRGERVGPFTPLKPSKLAQEAKVNVERRLLHQDVTITLQNYSKNDDKVWGTVTLGPHDISSYLLRQGLAWVEGWSMAPSNRDRYLRDEQMAQQEQKGRWAAEAPTKRKKRTVSSGWVVTQIYSADQLWLSSSNDASEGKKVYLAHIKAPRENRQPGSGASETYAWEAKEFVRQSLIGKPIAVKVIYTKTFPPRANEKEPTIAEFVTITYDGNRDIALDLVNQGFARVLRTNEMSRADNYFQLAEAHETASQKGLGVFGDDSKYKEPKQDDLTLPRMRNISEQKRENKKTEILRKSRKLMTRLGLQDNIDMGERGPGRNRDEKLRKTSQAIPAVIEYVFGATRMKARITVDGHMYLVILLLGGLRGLRGNDLNEKQRNLQQTADAWVRRKLQQQENVFVKIESLDKNSNFIGHVFMGSGRGASNLSSSLLENGWVEVFPNAARRSRYGNEYMQAEKNAKEAQLGMWEGWVEEKPEVKADPTLAGPASPKEPEKHAMEGKKLQADVTYVEKSNELYVVFKGDPQMDKKNAEVTNYMRTVNPAVNHIQDKMVFQPGDFVAGLFSGAYYRCRISSVRRKDRVHNVRFIDFGNRAALQEAEILPLEKFDKKGNVTEGSSMKTIEPLAKRCRLAGLKPPPEKSVEYCNAAGAFFANNAYDGVEVEVLAVSRKGKAEMYEVELHKDGVNLNELMVQQGWCRVDERAFNLWGGGREQKEAKYPQRKERLLQLQKEAIEGHYGMYQYGMVDSDDEA